jgi:hypothetical protein
VRAPLLLAVLAGIGLSACATPPAKKFAATASRSGVVEWRRDGRQISAHAVFETGVAGAFRVVVGADKPVLVLTRSGGEWTASGPIASRGWHGAGNTAPATLAGWMCVAEAFEGAAFAPPGASDVRTGRFTVRYTKQGDVLAGFELVVVATGDRFRVSF